MAKKKTDSSGKGSQAEVKKLRAQLKQAQKEAERWKKKAAQLERAHAGAVAEAKKRTKQRDRARRRLQEPAPEDGVGEKAAVASSDVADHAAAPEEAARPDGSWTVARLREEARARGLTGMSGKSKAQLLDALA